MKRKLLFLVLVFPRFLHAQDAYTDSLLAYQHHYKADLYEVIKEDTGYVRFFPPDKKYHVKATIRRLQNQPYFAMRTSSGEPRQARKFAIVTFQLNGKKHQLTAYQLKSLVESAKYHNAFFIPFLDEASGEQTYQGGRYLDFDIPDIHNNTLWIDFNKAYNPYCAFTTGYSCPIPPRENTLETVVAAGEKSFGKQTK